MGVFGFDILLTDINNFLSVTYPANSNKKIFIVEKSTGIMVGNNLGIPNYVVDSNGIKVWTDMFSNILKPNVFFL